MQEISDQSKFLEYVVFKSVLNAVSLFDLTSRDRNKIDTRGKRTLSLSEVAALTGLPKSNLYSRVNNRTIPFQKQGGRLVFDQDELMGWWNKNNRRKGVAISQNAIDFNTLKKDNGK